MRCSGSWSTSPTRSTSSAGGRDGLVLEDSVVARGPGKVIGREGRTVRALRTLLDARGDQQGERYELDLLDD